MNNDCGTYTFEIRINKADQKILIVDHLLKNNDYYPVKYEDFDAVMYTTTDVNLLYTQFSQICSPFTHNAFQFKPVFFSTLITERPLISSSDGLADDINSQVIIDEVTRIQTRMSELGFRIFFTEPDFWTTDRHFHAFCRHCLSRSNRLPEMEIVKGSPFGYLHPLLYVMLKGLGLPAAEFLAARNKVIGEFDYLDNQELVAIVHVCPKCFDKGLIYQETCPKCGSIDVVEQNMLHHFRCANISPEMSYMKDGELICPKCSRALRHIGVDYDRPTTSYTCNKCGVNFSEPKIICECENCLTKSNIETLIPIPLSNVTINALGQKMLAITNDFTYSDDTPKFPNILSLNQFKNVLNVRLSIVSNMMQDKMHVLRVYRAYLDSESSVDKYGAEIAARTYSIMPHANLTTRKNVMYMMSEETDRPTDEYVRDGLAKMLEGTPEGMLQKMDYVEYQFGMTPEEFNKLI